MEPRQLGKTLLAAALIFSVIIVLWPILMVMAETSGTVDERLMAIADHPGLYKLNFFVASLIAPSISLIMLLLALFVRFEPAVGLQDMCGLVLLPVYIVLVSIAYTSQYVLLPSLLAAGQLDQARLWFFQSEFSIPYLLNQLGYGFFGLSSILIGFKFLSQRGYAKTIGWLLCLIGITSVLAFLGLAVQSRVLNSLTFASGLLTLPFGVLVALWGACIHKSGRLVE